VNDGVVDERRKRFEVAYRELYEPICGYALRRVRRPDDAAEVILRGVQKNARRVLIGADARILDAIQRLFPGTYHHFMARFARSRMQAGA